MWLNKVKVLPTNSCMCTATQCGTKPPVPSHVSLPCLLPVPARWALIQ